MARETLRRALDARRHAAHHEMGEADPLKLLGHQLAHLAGTQQQRAAAGDVAMDVARELQRRGGDRHGTLGDARLAPHPPRRRRADEAAKAPSSSTPARPSSAASRCAAFTCPSTCGSPMTRLSSALATAKRWRSAAAPSWR